MSGRAEKRIPVGHVGSWRVAACSNEGGLWVEIRRGASGRPWQLSSRFARNLAGLLVRAAEAVDELYRDASNDLEKTEARR